MARRLTELIDELYAPQPPATLYHYTTLAGLKGMVERKKIWATDAHFLGDSSELRDLGRAIMFQIGVQIEDGPSSRVILSQLRDWLKNRLETGPFLFVASLTENGNLLSQWRGYSPFGKGVSLGFSSRALAASVSCDSFRIAKCIYDHESKKSIAARVLEAFVINAEEHGEAPPSKAHPTQSFHPAFLELEEYLFTVAALLKDSSFGEEKEWRVISKVHSNFVEIPILYREGAHSLIPYMEVSLPANESNKLLLENVFVGPTPNPKESFTSVDRYLSKYAHCPMVTNSMSPFRSL